MHELFQGALTIESWAIALFFLRFWRDSGDRLFIVFAIAFVILGVDWGVRGIWPPSAEARHYFYLARLVAFVLLIVAIIDKNRRAR